VRTTERTLRSLVGYRVSVVTGPRKVAPWVRRGGPTVLMLALLAYLVIYLRWPSLATQVDLQVYRFGALRMRDGLDLYSIGLTGNPRTLLFIYPPFAALCFAPLAFITEPTVQVVWLSLACALTGYVIWRMLTAMRLTAATGLLSLSALLLGLVAWLEPFRLSLQLGQINIVILAVVLADLLGPARSRWAGVGIGLAAGIKLTPALFIVYLVAVGRLRAAAVAGGTFAATVAVGWLLLPTDSTFYWLRRGFRDVNRISADQRGSTSVSGILLRLHAGPAEITVASVALAATAVIVAAFAWRRGQRVLGIALVGMGSAVASPFSWDHHWVWFAPLMVHLGYRAYVLAGRFSAWAMWSLWVLLGGWFTSFGVQRGESGVLSLRPGGVWNDVIAGTYVYVFLAAVLGTACWLRRARPAAPQERDSFGIIRSALPERVR
jgi:alpha-1,2-mannosyltransferase